MKLSGTDRVAAAIDHKETDRVPLDIGGTRVSGIHEWAYQRYRAHWNLPTTAPPWQVRYLQLSKLDSDFRYRVGADIESADPDTAVLERDLKVDEATEAYVDMWGCTWSRPIDGGYYHQTVHPLADADSVAAIERYPWPSGSPSDVLATIEGQTRLILQAGRFPFLGRTCPGVFEMLQVLCGHEKAYVDLVALPAVSEAIMERVLEHKIEFYSAAIERVLQAGAKRFIIGESDDFGSQAGLLISRDMYRRLVKPRHARLFAHIKQVSGGRAAIELHSCGSIRELLPDLIEAGVEIINPVQVSATSMSDTAGLKAEFGADLVFHGGAVDSQHTLPYGSPAEIRDEVRRRANDLAPGGGFIFTPVHSIQHDVPTENFEALLEAYRDFCT